MALALLEEGGFNGGFSVVSWECVAPSKGNDEDYLPSVWGDSPMEAN